MFKDKKILAFIGARGGSKGLKNKNILDLGGKPLIAWTIEAALGSKYIDRTIVSTDSRGIANIAKVAGADVPFLRPAALAKDNSPAEDALRHGIEWLKKRENDAYDFIMMLQPTSPLRSTRHIDKAIEYYFKQQRSKRDTLVSVVKAPVKSGWLMEKNSQGYVNFSLLDKKRARSRQELPSYLLPNGAIYIAPVGVAYEGGFYSEQTLPFEMKEGDSIDIDSLEDLDECRQLMQSKK